MDAHPCSNDEETSALLEQHICAIRSNDFLKDAPLIMLCEKNTGHESGHLWNVMKKHDNTNCFREPSSDKAAEEMMSNAAVPKHHYEMLENPHKNPGFHTGPLLKMTSRETLDLILSRDELYVLDGCVSGNPHMKGYTTMESKVIFYLEMLVEQMSRARIYPTRAAVGGSVKTNYTWSAKVNEEDKLVATFRDDLVVILALTLEISKKACDSRLPGFPYEQIQGGKL